MVLLTKPGEGGEFSQIVLGTDFRGIGDVDHFRLYHVLVCVGVQNLLYQIRRQLAVRGGDSQNFVACGFDSAGFMDIDVPGFRSDHRLVGPEGRADNQQIGLSSAGDNMNIRGIVLNLTMDKPDGMGCVGVLTVAVILLQICTDNGV